MANDLAIQQQQLATILDKRKTDIQALLPKGVTVEAFTRLAKNAIMRDPKIAEADPTSVFLEVSKAAQDGLVLDGREAVLTRFVSKRGNEWVTNVAYIPMIAGIKKRVMNSRIIKSWNISLVYKNETLPDENGNTRFEYFAGDEPKIFHKPIIIGDRGPVVAAYSSARLADGSFHHEVMTIDQLKAIKNRTKSKSKDGNITGPWASDEEEMFRKTVARRHAKSLPMSAEDMDVVRRVDALYDLDDGEDDIQPQPEPDVVANRRKTSAASKLRRDPTPVEPTGSDENEEQGETPHTIDGEILTAEDADDAEDGDKGPDDPF